jgi:hypothetical protein
VSDLGPRAKRFLAVVATFALVGVLSGCTTPSEMQAWLEDRPGVVAVEVIADSDYPTGFYLLAELDPVVTDETVVTLIEDAAEFARNHPDEALPLTVSSSGVDLELTTVPQSIERLTLWRALLDIDGIGESSVGEHRVSASVPRSAMIETLRMLPTELQRQVLSSDELDHERWLTITASSHCELDEDLIDYASSAFSDRRIRGANLALCDSFHLTYDADADLAATAMTVWDDLDRRGLSSFPVRVHLWSPESDESMLSSVWVTPGEPRWIERVGDLAESEPGFPFALGRYGVLEVTSADLTASELLDEILSTPEALGFDTYSIRGSDTGVVGDLEKVTALLR